MKLYIDYLEEIQHLNSKKENFYCASYTLLKTIDVYLDNISSDEIFRKYSQNSSSGPASVIESFSYRSVVLKKKDQKLIIIVKILYLLEK